MGSKACGAQGLGCSEQSLHHGVPFNLAQGRATVQWSALEEIRPPDHVAKLHRQIFKEAKKILSERRPFVGKMTFHLSYTPQWSLNFLIV